MSESRAILQNGSWSIRRNCVGYKLSEERFDCGSKLGFIQANIRYSIERPEMKQKLKSWLKQEIVSDS